ncbi:MAG TPA: DUF4410 domain-containing protein [Candidatus Acidoferrum sp.]|nr:DUF4410 domain-containing protein [Candidatus Acidoferrum sp.]
MKLPGAISLVVLIICAIAAQAGLQPTKAYQAPDNAQSDRVSAKAVLVYVSDFDLDIALGKVTARDSSLNSSNSSATNSSERNASAPKRSSGASTSTQKQDTPAEQANILVNGMSEVLRATLQKAGYKVLRLRAGEARPSIGIQIRGVFAEADEQNRVRRLLVGGRATSPTMLLFVGVNNLERPEQPLYGLLNSSTEDQKYGPLITITPYAPVSRFELDKTPTDEELRRVAEQIAANLTALLNANPTAVTP